MPSFLLNLRSNDVIIIIFIKYIEWDDVSSYDIYDINDKLKLDIYPNVIK